MAKKKKSWRDLSKGQKAMVMLSGAVNMSLLIAAQRSLAKTPDAEIRGKKALWRAASFINFFGPVSYFVFGRKRDAGAAAAKR
jgi:hypothetical protein